MSAKGLNSSSDLILHRPGKIPGPGDGISCLIGGASALDSFRQLNGLLVRRCLIAEASLSSATADKEQRDASGHTAPAQHLQGSF